jgi:hypothetical protein
MNRVICCIFDGAFAILKAPLFMVILLAMVVSAMRHSPGRLAPARAHKPTYR